MPTLSSLLTRAHRDARQSVAAQRTALELIVAQHGLRPRNRKRPEKAAAIARQAGRY